MALPTAEQLQELLASLTQATKAYDPTPSPEGIASRATIKGLAKQLYFAVTTPEEIAWYHVSHMTELVAIRTCLKLDLFKFIPVDGSITGPELAKAVSASPGLVERMIRLLVGTGFLGRADSHGIEYVHTKFSKQFVDVNQPSAGTFFKAMYDVYFRSVLDLDQYIEENYATSGNLYVEPTSNFHNPFVRLHNSDGESVWDVMATKTPDTMRLFQISLKAMDEMLPAAGPWYDFSQFKTDDDRVEIVDVGGGYGKVLREIVAATPALDPKKCVLQDVAGVIGIADEARAAGLQTMVIDFHGTQPVKGAKAYYMRFITHDYSDTEATNILSHVAAAMSPDSRLLVADCVIPDLLNESNVSAAVLDQLMFCIGGKERTRLELAAMFDKVGLELLDVKYVTGSAGAITEARLKQ